MRLPYAARLCASAIAIAIAIAAALSACGGNVVVDPAGEGGGSTTTIPPTTSTFPPTTTTSTTTTTITPTPTITSTCDGTGTCIDGTGMACVDCALSGPCADAFNACAQVQQCLEVDQCIFSCPDPGGCLEVCAAQYPEGFPLYQALVECAICQQCAVDCDGQFPWPCP